MATSDSSVSYSNLTVVPYFKIGLAKMQTARTVAAHMEPDRNVSRSFQVFRSALAEMAL
jgi:hypothetical protein